MSTTRYLVRFFNEKQTIAMPSTPDFSSPKDAKAYGRVKLNKTVYGMLFDGFEVLRLSDGHYRTIHTELRAS